MRQNPPERGRGKAGRRQYDSRRRFKAVPLRRRGGKSAALDGATVRPRLYWCPTQPRTPLFPSPGWEIHGTAPRNQTAVARLHSPALKITKPPHKTIQRTAKIIRRRGKFIRRFAEIMHAGAESIRPAANFTRPPGRTMELAARSPNPASISSAAMPIRSRALRNHTARP